MIVERLVEHFGKLLNADVSDQSKDTGIMEGHEDRERVEQPPTIAEVEVRNLREIRP
jgi:hypothetical protein